MKIAIFPGSFDPFTIGHKDIVLRALPLFDRLVIAIGQNQDKTPCFSVEERVDAIRRCFADYPQVEVAVYSGLTADFARERGANYLIRGVRTSVDYEYEKQMADANRELTGVETLLLYTKPEYGHISSSLVRDLKKHNHPIDKYLA